MKLLPLLGYLFMRTLHATLRVRHVRAHYANETAQKIIAFWHENILMAMHSIWQRPTTAIISRSKDGEIVAGVLRLYGAESARGSSTRGGEIALREVLREAKSGKSIGITPDGPIGPRREVKAGLVHIARASGLPIVPFYFTAQHKKRLRSWDGQIVPRPLSKAIYLYGPPITVPRHSDVEEWRLKVEGEMKSLAEEAERDFESLWREGKKR
jgi:lysophospholipid acyltransferase (LPLAT)-like uncharacterized protein